MFTPAQLAEAIVLEAKDLGTRVFLNRGSLNFEKVDLPSEVQFSCTYAISVFDYDGDDNLDILLSLNVKFCTNPSDINKVKLDSIGGVVSTI